MTIDSDFEAHIANTLAEVLRGASGLSTLPLQVSGVRLAQGESVAQWLALDVLSMPRRPSRPGVWWGQVLFQVTCFAREAEDQSTGKADVSLRTAGKVREALSQKNIAIKNYGVTPLSTVANLSVREAQLQRLPPQDGSNVWAVAVTFTGHITTT